MKNAYPRWLHPPQTLDGSKRIVQDALEEERYTGVKMQEDGSVFDDPEAAPEPAAEVTTALQQAEDHQAIADELNLS